MNFIQPVSLSDFIIEGSKYKLQNISSLGINQDMSISLNVEDRALSNYLLVNREKLGQNVFLEEDKNKIEVILQFYIFRIKHILIDQTGKIESMVFIKPKDRMVESVFLYMKNTEICDPRFVERVKSVKN
jgi:hypothetical protein